MSSAARATTSILRSWNCTLRVRVGLEVEHPGGGARLAEVGAEQGEGLAVRDRDQVRGPSLPGLPAGGRHVDDRQARQQLGRSVVRPPLTFWTDVVEVAQHLGEEPRARPAAGQRLHAPLEQVGPVEGRSRGRPRCPCRGVLRDDLTGTRLPVERADQHHPQLGAGGLGDLLLGVRARAGRRAAARRWRPSRSRSGWRAPAGPRRTSASVPGSRARSVASSRSHSSISWRIASRTDGGPAARSRAMKRKCDTLRVARAGAGSRPSSSTMSAERRRRAGAPYVAEHRAQGDERLVDQGQPEGLDRVEVPVERGRHDADLLGHLAQRQRDQAAVLAEGQRGVQDRAPGALLALALDSRRHGPTILVGAHVSTLTRGSA